MLKIVGDISEKRVDTAVFIARSRRRLVRFSLSPLRGKDKTIKGYLLVGRKQKEDYGEGFVDASNGLTERMLESFASPLFIIDGPTRFVRDCNGIATDVFGFAREEFIGRRLLDHISDQERKQNEALLEKADKTYATAGVFQERFLFSRKNLPPVLCDCIGLPFLKSDGSLDTIIVMLFDRSSEEDCEAELLRVIDRIKKFSDELAEMAKHHSEGTRVQYISDSGFTPRQIEIAYLIVQGASSKEIGVRLGITESTVKNHLSVMYKRLSVTSRIGLINKLLQQHLMFG